ncbi:MAG: hypothetical protein IJ404_04250 [Clostridia bacterium]|nr:hypothetical protein [Clostridia bacterium]
MKKRNVIAFIMAMIMMLPCLITSCSTHKHEFSDATCSSPAKCKCGETKGEPLEHDWTEASCRSDISCKLCGTCIADSKLDHEWSKATCTQFVKCVMCGVTSGKKGQEHNWEKVETAEVCSRHKCSNCNEVKNVDHSWLSANCQRPKTCNSCGQTEGKKTGHNWTEATCEAPKTCSYCKATEGEIGLHKVDNYSSNCKYCGENNPINVVTLGFDIAIHRYSNGYYNKAMNGRFKILEIERTNWYTLVLSCQITELYQDYDDYILEYALYDSEGYRVESSTEEIFDVSVGAKFKVELFFTDLDNYQAPFNLQLGQFVK